MSYQLPQPGSIQIQFPTSLGAPTPPVQLPQSSILNPQNIQVVTPEVQAAMQNIVSQTLPNSVLGSDSTHELHLPHPQHFPHPQHHSSKTNPISALITGMGMGALIGQGGGLVGMGVGALIGGIVGVVLSEKM